MKLIFNGKSVEVKEKIPSHKLKNIFINKLASISQNQLQYKILDILKDEGIDGNVSQDELLQKAIREGKIKLEELIETPEKIIQKDRVYRELAIEIVDERQLTSQQKEIFSTDPDSDFWLEQDVMEVEAAVDRFRAAFKLQNF